MIQQKNISQKHKRRAKQMADKLLTQVFVTAESSAIIIGFPIYCLGILLKKIKGEM